MATDAPRSGFDPGCRRCPRLANFLDDVRRRYPTYHARPVPSFGDAGTRLLVVGLAPGLHGANATGRPFTGDFAGILLYETLHEFGFASAASGTSADDGLRLLGCRITNAVRCVPPANKPVTREIVTCNGYLRQELAALPEAAVVLALGSIAHGAVLRALDLRLARFPFGHGHQHELGAGLQLFDSYHCSRYNTQTRRLTPEMFRAVLAAVRQAVDVAGHARH